MEKISIIGSESFLARNLVSYIESHGLNYEIFLYDCCEKCSLGGHEYKKIDFSDYNDLRNIRLDVEFVFVFIGLTGTVSGFNQYDKFIDVNEKYFLHILKHIYNTVNFILACFSCLNRL